MIKSIKHMFILAIALCFTTGMHAQSLKVPAPSPLQTLKQSFALSEIGLEYYRPSAKGRTVFGDLVPFGKIWRTGANGATKITFGEDVTVEGTAVKAGTYALYSVPGKDNWEIMLYKDLKLGGDVNSYKKEDELLRFTVKTQNLSDKVETFTINIADITNSSSNIELTWENTKVSFSVKADIDANIMASIDKAMNVDSKPYYQAASYYYENGKDLKLALEWINKASEQNPKAYWVVLLKAKIEHKSGDSKACMSTCDKVIQMATEAKNDDYVKMAEKLKEDAKKSK